MERDLGLPQLEVRLAFLPDTKAFRDLLVRIGYPTKLARESARQMVAIGGHRTVLINQARLERRGWSWRMSILAHELAHVLQYALGGGIRGVSAQWLREGFAEWVKVRVLETLGGPDVAKARSRAQMRVRTNAIRVMTLGVSGSIAEAVNEIQSRTRLPPLATLSSYPEWVAQSRNTVGGVLYDYSFIAVSLLIEKHGAAALIHYFSLFAERQDHTANFLEAFGEPEAEFEKRLREAVWG
jgi:hypothetical protein